MTLLDGVLLLACLGFLVSGLRQGFVVGALSFVGFVGGGVAGMLLTPSLVGDWDPGLSQVVAAVAVVMVLATVGQVLLALAGVSVRGRLSWRPARVLDSVAGGLVSVVAVLVIAWFVASALRAAPVPALSKQVRESDVLAAVEQVMPAQARGAFGSFRTLLGESGYPQVFSGLAPERIVPVDPPDPGALDTAGIRAAAASIVDVRGNAEECRRSVDGSGFVFAPERVLTNAHVVAGVDAPRVRVGGEGEAYAATVVVFDPLRDLAVLDVPGLPAEPLVLDDDVDRGAQAVVAGFPRGGPYRTDAARVRERITARGPDIYASEQVDREVLSLFATVQPGNSGGPLVSAEGTVVGVVFAKSLDDPRTGYALTIAEAEPVIEAGRTADAGVSTQGCAA